MLRTVHEVMIYYSAGIAKPWGRGNPKSRALNIILLGRKSVGDRKIQVCSISSGAFYGAYSHKNHREPNYLINDNITICLLFFKIGRKLK